MDYIKAEQKGRDTIIFGTRFFNLEQTLDNGQAFRWEKHGGGFTGIAHGRRMNVYFKNEDLILENTSLDEFSNTWKAYFDLRRDYKELRDVFSRSRDSGTICKAMAFSPGLRLMRQDIWEVLISFILSQNANIPRIKKMITALCECFGEKLPGGGYAFPAPQTLSALSESGLAPIRCGYRAPYILDAARKTANGEFNLTALQLLPSADIFSALLKIHGVGPKVAECVLLYGFGRVETYPKDVWIKRAMSSFYPNGFPDEIKDYAGIAQQFLFHYVRNL